MHSLHSLMVINMSFIKGKVVLHQTLTNVFFFNLLKGKYKVTWKLSFNQFSCLKCATLKNTTKCVLLKSTSLKRILNPGWLKIDRAVCNTHASILYDLCTGWIGFCLTCYLGCLMLYLSDSLFDALFKWFFVWVILCIIDSLLGWFIDDSKEILDMFLTSCVCVWRYIIFALISHYICWW